MLLEELNDALLIRVEHVKLDAAQAASFRTELSEAVAGHRRVVLDMSNVKYIDSSGLGALIGVLKTMESGGVLRLVHCTSTVQKVIQLTRLDRVFPSYETLEAALAG
ncbi:MAG: STAS domain-containing protein [Myxococcota bacterium]